MRTLPALLAAVALSACAVKPVLYPNDHYKQVGEPRSRQDAKDCDAKAKAYLKSDAAKQAAKKTVEGAAVGAAAGAVTGAIFGDLGRGIASGSAAGAAVGLVEGLWHWRDPSPARKRFVERCLSDQGYVVLGWQ